MGRPNYGWDHEKWMDRAAMIQAQIDSIIARKMEPAKDPKVLEEAKWPDMQHVHLKGVPELMLPYRNRLIVFTDISVAAVTVDEFLGRHPKKAK